MSFLFIGKTYLIWPLRTNRILEMMVTDGKKRFVMNAPWDSYRERGKI